MLDSKVTCESESIPEIDAMPMSEPADLGIDPEFDECGREDPPAIEL